MKVVRFTFNMFQVSCYFVYDPETKEAAIVDPGMIATREREALDNFAKDYKVTQIINTHLHLDHIFGDRYAKDKYGVEIKAGKEDEFLVETFEDQIERFHLPVEAEGFDIDVYLKDGDIIKLGHEELHVISVPGHSPGSIALYCPESKFVITGDALFKGSIGRTDLERGNHAQLVDSVRRKLLSLPDDTLVLPGHGPTTTIGEEKASNPYL